MDEQLQSLGQRLRQARIAVGMSQKGLARASGIEASRLSRYENDHVVPSLATLHRLAEAVHIPEGRLLGEGDGYVEEFLHILRERGLSVTSRMEAVTLGNALADMLQAGPTQRAGQEGPDLEGTLGP